MRVCVQPCVNAGLRAAQVHNVHVRRLHKLVSANVSEKETGGCFTIYLQLRSFLPGIHLPGIYLPDIPSFVHVLRQLVTVLRPTAARIICVAHRPLDWRF